MLLERLQLPVSLVCLGGQITASTVVASARHVFNVVLLAHLLVPGAHVPVHAPALHANGHCFSVIQTPLSVQRCCARLGPH
jgi:hypothetical protein